MQVRRTRKAGRNEVLWGAQRRWTDKRGWCVEWSILELGVKGKEEPLTGGDTHHYTNEDGKEEPLKNSTC